MARRPSRPAAPPVLPEQLVSDPAQLVPCLDHLAGCPVIGFDTEFVGEQSYRPELCLIQVATPQRLYVIDPFRVGSLDRFWELLLDPGRTTVVHAGREDVRMCYFQTGRPPAQVFDTQVAAGLVGLSYPIGYGGLVLELLGFKTSKSETLTDWRRRPLSPAQVRYAFDDVRFLLPAWRKLSDRLRRLRRADWAAEEFAAAVQRALADEQPEAEPWRKVKGLGALDRRQLAVARELFRWREAYAQRLNRPARQLLRDDVLVEVARHAPTHVEDLAAYRGIPRGEVDAILQAVRTALALPPEQCPAPEPRESDSPQVTLLAGLLQVVLSDWCTRNRVAVNLVATGADLRAVVRQRLGRGTAADIPLTRGWRAEAVLPELLAVLEGRTAIRVENARSATPLGLVPLPLGTPDTPPPPAP